MSIYHRNEVGRLLVQKGPELETLWDLALRALVLEAIARLAHLGMKP